MNKKIILICLIPILIIGGYFGLSQFYDHINYDPQDEEKFLNTSSKEDWKFGTLLSIYIGMSYPGIRHYNEHIEDTSDYISKGFGNYEYSTKLQKSYEELDITTQDNIIFNINQSQLSFEELSNEKLLDKKYFTNNRSSQEILDEINDISDTSLIDVSISFLSKKSATQILSYINQYSHSTFTYLVLGYAGDQYYGMSLRDMEISLLNGTANKKYPYLNLDENNMTPDNLKQSYLSRLRLLNDHQEFIKLISNSPLNKNIETLENRYKAVEKDFSIYGIKALMTKQELLSIINKNKCTIHIDEVIS